MKAHQSPGLSSFRLTTWSITRLGIFLLPIAFLAAPFLSASSASLLKTPFMSGLVAAVTGVSAERLSMNRSGTSFHHLLGVPAFLPLPQAQAPETITIYQSDCTTPDSSFALGDQLCAKITGAPAFRRRLAFVNPSGYIVSQVTVTNDPQTLSFTLPTGATTVIGETTVDNRGKWRVISVESVDSETRIVAGFTVSDPQVSVADVSIAKAPDGAGQVAAGSLISFSVYVYNNGPDAAAAVAMTDAVPTNTSFFSATQDSGPAFTCTNPAAGSNTGTTSCTISSLPADAKAHFTLTYRVDNAAPASTEIVNIASVSTTTLERSTSDNSAKAAVAVAAAAAAPSECTLDCPSDISVTANTTQNGLPDGTPGANVTFASAGTSGDCGTLSTSVPSGSFFPVGSTTVQVSSSQGGGSCSFVVTVVDNQGPDITCPANVVTTTADCAAATVDPGTPTTSPAGLTVSGERGDNQPLNGTYPVGVTTITWTATDAQGRVDSCTQTITVNSTDAVAPTITAPADVNVATPSSTSGSCGVVVGESQLGTAEAADNCTFNVARTGVPAGNFFPLGTTTITYTVTDNSGNTATDTQNVVVTDATAPVIFAPADENYVCPSEVPAANPSQATGPEVIVNGQPQPGPPADNCSATTVTVAETSSGAGSAGDPLIITRTYTATDAAGNSASASQTITVADGVAPAITAPDDATYQCASQVPAGNANQATASDNCATPTVTLSETSSGSGSTASPRVITRTYTATDAAGNTQSDSQTITVIDNTAPIITLTGANPQVVECHTSYTELGATAADNCGGTAAALPSGSVNVDVPGNYTITYNATDAAGNSATPVSRTVTVVDTTAPTISCPANIVVTLPANSTATSMPVSFAVSASDSCDSTVAVATNLASGSVFNVGTTVVTATATDDSGNSTSCSFNVTVLYNFAGFFSPIGNNPILNVVNAGRAIPVKFSLSGDKGLSIFAAGSPYTIPLDCGSGAPVDIEETLTTGNSSLSYSSSSDQYNYVWKTESSWAGTCRQLVVKLNDGSEHKANFKFR